MTVRAFRPFLRLLRPGLTFALLSLLVAPGRAQPSTASPPGPGDERGAAGVESQEAPRREQARERFVRGLSLAKMGSRGSALAEFTASLELFRTRAALTNIAVCLRQLGRFVEAKQAYSQLLNEPGRVSADERAELEDELEALNAQIGEIRVESDPQGAVVIVDSQQRGVTPLTAPVWVDAGTHSVRVFRPGFSSLEATVTVAGREVSKVRAVLEPIRQVGSILVQEATGSVLGVVVNGAVMGQTPWQGALPPGTYSIALQGAGDLGTAPSSATVRANQTVTLVLTSTRLDAEVRIEPTPAHARVTLDGVSVGNGVWLGRVASGSHRVEVDATGYVSVQRTFNARRGERAAVPIRLERDLSSSWQRANLERRAYVDAIGGLAWAPSLGGSADESCGGTTLDLQGSAGASCTSSSHPVGLLLGLRGGYLPAPRIGVEVFFGYLRLSERLTRRILADYERQPNRLFSDDYRDTTQVGGPIAALSASYRFLERTPITLRVWLGVGRMQVNTSNHGSFVGRVDGVATALDHSLSSAEKEQSIWLPFAGPEVRFGYPLGKDLELDLGLAALLLVPGKTPRSGTWSDVPGDRSAPIPDPDGDGNLGVYKVPDEQALGTALTLVPSFAVHYRF